MTHRLQPFDATLQKSDVWMRQMMEEMETQDPQVAYHGLRAGLHALRNRLIPSESAHLAAQLPLLIRGLYYENWDPDVTPEKIRTYETFIDRVTNELPPAPPIDPEITAQAVFHLLQRRVTQGEMDDVRDMLPAELEPLWSHV